MASLQAFMVGNGGGSPDLALSLQAAGRQSADNVGCEPRKSLQ
jgi:hypothetical protein